MSLHPVVVCLACSISFDAVFMFMCHVCHVRHPFEPAQDAQLRSELARERIRDELEAESMAAQQEHAVEQRLYRNQGGYDVQQQQQQQHPYHSYVDMYTRSTEMDAEQEVAAHEIEQHRQQQRQHELYRAQQTQHDAGVTQTQHSDTGYDAETLNRERVRAENRQQRKKIRDICESVVHVLVMRTLHLCSPHVALCVASHRVCDCDVLMPCVSVVSTCDASRTSSIHVHTHPYTHTHTHIHTYRVPRRRTTS